MYLFAYTESMFLSFKKPQFHSGQQCTQLKADFSAFLTAECCLTLNSGQRNVGSILGWDSGKIPQTGDGYCEALS